MSQLLSISPELASTSGGHGGGCPGSLSTAQVHLRFAHLAGFWLQASKTAENC